MIVIQYFEKIAAAAACCAGNVVLQDAVVQVFKAAQNVLDLQIKEPVVARSTGGWRGDGDSRRCEVAVDGGFP
jgi:hypothetical protein